MRTFTTKHVVYNFDELSATAQDAAIEHLSDINVDHNWWEFVYEDAELIGLELQGFDLYRHDIEGELTEDLPEVCKAIMREHGNETATYSLAVKWQHKHGEDNEAEFLKELLQEYLSILSNDYDYLTSREAIVETINANEYEFYEDGRMA